MVVDALSQKAQLGALENLEGGASQVTIAEDVLDRVKEGLENDSQDYHIVLQVHSRQTQRFSLQDVLLYYAENHFYILKWKEFHRELLQECHGST